jgi:tight adherence protein B
VMRSPVRARVSSRVAAIQAGGRTYERSVSPLRDRRVSNIPVIEWLVGGRSWTERTRASLGRAGLPLRVGEYIALRTLAVAIGLAVGYGVAERTGGEPVARMFFAAAGFAVGFFGPAYAMATRIRRRHEQIETQLVELCDVMASMLQSGYGYAQALTATTKELEPPLSTELRRLLDTVRLGGDIDEALEELNQRLQSRDFDMVASAIAIQRRSGGNLAEILTGVASTIRQRQSFFREVRAITSKERFSAMFVAAFPLGIIAVLTLMVPETYGQLFTDPIGRVILGVALTLDLIGFAIIRKLVQVEV